MTIRQRAEKLLGRIEQNQKRINEVHDRYRDRMIGHSDDYLKEIFGWLDSGARTKKTLPYDAHNDSLDKVRDTGRYLSKQPTIISATSKLISFVIGTGHEYSAAIRVPSDNARRRASQERNQRNISLELQLGLEEIDWFAHQEESYNRLIRDGEFFRQVWTDTPRFDLTYIEPEDIRQPGSDQEIRMETVPDFIRGMFDGTKPPGVLGVIHDSEDARLVLGYWHRVDQMFEYLSPLNVQHAKDGVDKNDPRGVPRFYWGLKHAQKITGVDDSMCDLFMVQAEHAAVYDFDQTTLITDLERIASGMEEEKDEKARDGNQNEPGVKIAKGFKVEVPGVHVAAGDAIDILQQQQRFIGGLSDIPEHLITEDADSGNRSSLVAAEGPFDRRIKRDQRAIWTADREAIWAMVAKRLDLSSEQLTLIMRDIKLTADPPTAASRDRLNEIKGDEILHTLKAMSVGQMQRKYNLDSTQTADDLGREPSTEPQETQ